MNQRMSQEDFQALLALLFIGYVHADALGVIATPKHGKRLIFESLLSRSSSSFFQIKSDELPELMLHDFESTMLHALNGNHSIRSAFGPQHVACANEEFQHKAFDEFDGKYVTQGEFESFVKSSIRENQRQSNCKNCVIQLNNDEFTVGERAKFVDNIARMKTPSCAFHRPLIRGTNLNRDLGFEIDCIFLPSRSGYQLRCKQVALSLSLRNSMLNVLRLIGNGKVGEFASRMKSLEGIVLQAERPQDRSKFSIRFTSSASHHHELTFLPQLSREGIGLSISFLTSELTPFQAMNVQNKKMNQQQLLRSIIILKEDIERIWNPNLFFHKFSLFDRGFLLQTLESLTMTTSDWPIYQIKFMNTKNSLIEPTAVREFLDVCFDHRLVTTTAPSGIKTGFSLDFTLTDFGMWRVM